MNLIKTIACTSAFLLTPALASAAPTPSHDHGATAQLQPPQGGTVKPQEMKCPMMQGGMKIDAEAIPNGRGGAPTTGNGAGSMNNMHGMKCMQGDAATTPAPASPPERQHNHDHSGASTVW